MTRATSGVWWLLKSAVRTASGGVRSVEASRPSVFHRSSHLRQIRRKAHSSVKEKTPGPRKPPDHTDEDRLIGVPNPIAGPSTCAFAYGTIGQLGAAQAPDRGQAAVAGEGRAPDSREELGRHLLEVLDASPAGEPGSDVAAGSPRSD